MLLEHIHVVIVTRASPLFLVHLAIFFITRKPGSALVKKKTLILPPRISPGKRAMLTQEFASERQQFPCRSARSVVHLLSS